MFIIKEGVEADKIGEGTEKKVQESITKWLEAQGFTVRTTDQDKSFVKQQVQDEVDSSYRNHNDKLDAAIKEATGLTKNSSEKTTEFLTRSISEKLDGIKDLESKIEELKDKGIDGNEQAKQYKSELENLQEKVVTMNTDHETALTAERGKNFKMLVDADIETAMNFIKSGLRDDMEDDILNDVLEARITRFNNENTPETFDGHIVYKDSEGKTRVGKKDGKPMNTAEVLSGYFDDLKKKVLPGSGSGSGGDNDGKGGKGDQVKIHEKITVPDTVKTQVKLHEFLSDDQKLDPATKEFSEAYEALGKGLPIK